MAAGRGARVGVGVGVGARVACVAGYGCRLHRAPPRPRVFVYFHPLGGLGVRVFSPPSAFFTALAWGRGVFATAPQQLGVRFAGHLRTTRSRHGIALPVAERGADAVLQVPDRKVHPHRGPDRGHCPPLVPGGSSRVRRPQHVLRKRLGHGHGADGLCECVGRDGWVHAGGAEHPPVLVGGLLQQPRVRVRLWWRVAVRHRGGASHLQLAEPAHGDREIGRLRLLHDGLHREGRARLPL